MFGHDLYACAGFDSQPWYSALFDFELGSSAGAGNGSSGGDSDLVPQLVTQVLDPLCQCEDCLHSLQRLLQLACSMNLQTSLQSTHALLRSYRDVHLCSAESRKLVDMLVAAGILAAAAAAAA